MTSFLYYKLYILCNTYTYIMEMNDAERRLAIDTLDKMKKMAKSLMNSSISGYGLSLRSYVDTLEDVLGLEKEEE